jgi:cystathionine gamma-synthase
MRTLFLRVRHASASALKIARHFDGHPKLVEVLYPGLARHPGHGVAARQMEGGFGAMLSLRVKGGAEGALKVASRCRLWVRATSLGGTESLLEHRASVEGPSSPVQKDLLRLSVGLEAAGDLIDDLEQALQAV